jgi:DNA-binding NtrC family response regulator
MPLQPRTRPLTRSAVVLISTDGSLVKSCQGLIGAFPDLDLFVLPRPEDAYPKVDGGEVALVLAHLARREDREPIARLLRRTAQAGKPTATLVIGDEDQTGQALALLRLGAADYLGRPLDLSRLGFLVDTLTVRDRFARQAAPAPPEQAGKPGGPDPLAFLQTAGMGRLAEQVRRVIPQETTLLLGGESGTGKTRLARLIHQLSPRAGQPFLVINCGALSSSLIESELFGHVKGAFTGADRDRAGKLADVGRGTLLLDEVDALPPDMQAKLLRAVEERVFEPVGSNRSFPVQARLIAASNRELAKEVAAGRFRADLFYRLNVVAFHLPPLRARREVIPSLVAGFIEEFAGRNSRPIRGIAPDALAALERHDWPGNIRELRNVIERAVALCPGHEIELTDLPEPIVTIVTVAEAETPDAGRPTLELFPPPVTLDAVRDQAEVSRIEDALRRNNNNRLKTAAELGISRMTLYNKLYKYGLIDCAQQASC